MPKYVVRKGRDAFVYYETVVDAATPEEAQALAESIKYDGEWVATGEISEFDDYDIDEYDGVRRLEDGEILEAFLNIGVTARERDVMLAGLRLLQLALARDDIDPPLRSILTNDGAQVGLDSPQIDALCERISQ